MIAQLAIVPILAGMVAMATMWLDSERLCRDLSAQTYQDFKSGDAPVIISRCPVPKPLQ